MIELVIDARRKDLGGGLEVGRVLPFHKRRMVGPFIFLDHMGPASFREGEGIDVRPHPHIGLATVTFLFNGEMWHRDSLGTSQAIRPGEVNWMTAGRGIVHSERTAPEFRARGGSMHGMQAWVALSDFAEETEPSFTHYEGKALPGLSEKGLGGTLVAGTAFGLQSPVKTFSPMFYADAVLATDASVSLPQEHEERAAYVVSGRVTADGAQCGPGQLIVFGRGGSPSVVAKDGPAHVMLLGGAPVGPRHIWWNLVS